MPMACLVQVLGRWSHIILFMALKALVVDIVCFHVQRLPYSFYILSMYGNPVILRFAIADNSIPSCHRQMFIDIPESNRRLGT